MAEDVAPGGFEVGDVERFDRRDGDGGRIGDEDVDGAEARRDVREEAFDGRAFAQVDGFSVHHDLVRDGELGAGGVDIALRACADRHFASLCRETAGNREPQTSRSAAHDGDHAVELLHGLRTTFSQLSFFALNVS